MTTVEQLEYIHSLLSEMLNKSSFADDLEKTKEDLMDIQYVIEQLRQPHLEIEEKKYECPQCYGSGIYGIFIYDPIHSEDYIEDKCDMCGGTGKLDRNEYSQVMEPPDISINTNMEDIPF